MVRWLRISRRARDRGSEGEVLELLVLEGADAGRRFTIDGPEVAIRRGIPSTSQPGEIFLTDPTVSSRQARIRATDEGLVIEHREGAKNPTIVNGREIVAKRIAAGDRIEMGRVVLEVRSRRGLSLSSLAQAPELQLGKAFRPDSGAAETWPRSADLTEVRAVERPKAHLTVVRGVSGWEGRRFRVEAQRTWIGRDPESGIQIPERGVSRKHAELVWEGDELILVHCSRTNPTWVNDRVVTDRQVLSGGEEIRLADRVVLRLDREAAKLTPEQKTAPDSHEASLRTVMEEKIRRDRAIQEKFGFVGSFLDIDVVDSYGLKAQASRPELIILSFERFRAFAGRVVEEFDGRVLNSNGDELMCFFESPLQAVRCASALLRHLEEFNEKQNLLSRPFRVRQGVHTGDSLVDRKRGIAYSPVLDVAGRLQKHCATNGLLISEETLKALPEGLPFQPAGKLEKESIPAYRLVGSIE